jgi:hypothetical protein
MRKVCDAMAKADQPLTTNDVTERMKARATITCRALALLVDEGHLRQ